jgi:hypothetical protein
LKFSANFGSRKPKNYDLRKGAKAAKYKEDDKFETRNPKFETISNGQKSQGPKQARSDFAIGF